MISEEKKQQVIDWIRQGCIYQQGVILYNQIGRNSCLKADFPRKQHLYQTKIIYELCKSAGLNYAQLQKNKQIPAIQQPIQTVSLVKTEKHPSKPTEIKSEPAKPVFPDWEDMPSNLPFTKIAEYPSVIRRVIAEYADIFQERSKTHRIMTEMPQGNSQTLKIRRAEIFDLVKSLTERLDFLYTIRQQYEMHRQIPSEEVIWPPPKEIAKPVLSDDPTELKRYKKNIQSQICRNEKQLDYQGLIKKPVKNPMPQGPRRYTIEKSIKAKLKLIEEIDAKLNQHHAG